MTSAARRPRGRPSSVPPLAGLTAPEIARAIHGPEATAGQLRVAGYHLAGATAMGVDQLAALLDARPDLDAREVVRELAARLRARREAGWACPEMGSMSQQTRAPSGAQRDRANFQWNFRGRCA